MDTEHNRKQDEYNQQLIHRHCVPKADLRKLVEEIESDAIERHDVILNPMWSIGRILRRIKHLL